MEALGLVSHRYDGGGACYGWLDDGTFCEIIKINCDDDDHGDAHDDVGVGWSMKATSSSLLVR